MTLGPNQTGSLTVNYQVPQSFLTGATLTTNLTASSSQAAGGAAPITFQFGP